jgi:hypothetical protein
MKRFLKSIFATAKSVYFFLYLLIKEDFIDYIKKAGTNNMCVSKKLIVLGNGPSIAIDIENLKTNDTFKNADALAVNYFCQHKLFIEIQPKYYVLSDGIFFDEQSIIKDKVNSMYESMNKNVSWTMFLYVHYYAWKKIDWKTKITNDNIKIIPFHSRKYSGNEIFKNWIFDKGICNCEYNTVIIQSEYIGLHLGYKELFLYGVDHNFFDSLYIDENNQVCNIISHFYDAKPILKPITRSYSGKETMYTMYEYLKGRTLIFYGHEVMKKYADHCQARIYNCTKNSLIDAYERVKYF